MPKPVARNKTKKSAAKRFKITATGKILRSRGGRRHLAASKSNSNKRRLARRALVDSTGRGTRQKLPSFWIKIKPYNR